MQRSLSAVSRLAPLARSAVPLGSRAPVLRAPVRAMSGGDGEHHSHDMFDMSTPYNVSFLHARSAAADGRAVRSLARCRII
jgi:hypothetical protein